MKNPAARYGVSSSAIPHGSFAQRRSPQGPENLPAVIQRQLRGGNDHFLRECILGGRFGSLQSSGRNVFNDAHEIYRFLAGFRAVVAAV
jgi:hypothetical protein